MKTLKLLSILMLIPNLCFGSASRDWDGTSNEKITFTEYNFGPDAPDTVAMWLDCDDCNGNNTNIIFGDDTDGSSNNIVNMFTNTTKQMQWRDNGAISTVTSQTGGWDTIWRFIVVANDTGTYRTYRDGTQLLSTSDTANALHVGDWGDATSSANQAFDGRMAYFHAYDGKFLNAVEMMEIMYKPYMIVDSSYTFLPAWGDTAEQDLSGNNRDGTVTGPATHADGPPVMFGGGLPL